MAYANNLRWVASKPAKFLARRRAVLAALTLAMTGCAASGDPVAPAASPAEIVTLGASNTAGFRVAPSQAYPAHLQAMLRAEGQAVTVLNSGISGDTTAGMLRRLDAAVPAGARVVIFQPGGNDARGGGDSAANVASITSRLEARGIRVILLDNAMLRALPSDLRQADGIHYTSEGYKTLAGRLLPQVKAALVTERR